MTRIILIFSTAIFFYSCKESLPKGVIKPEKMQRVLWDVLQADALSQELIKRDSSRSIAQETIRLTNKVFVIHNITKEQFEKSYSYYTNHPDIMSLMLDSINAQQTRVNMVQVPVKSTPVMDSIRKIK